VDVIEAKIKALFADIPAQPNGAERVYYPVTDNEEPIVVIEKEKEQPVVQVLLFNKHEAIPNEEKGNLGYLITNYAKQMIGSMINARLDELRQNANPPYIQAGAYDGAFFAAKTKDAFTGYAICKEDDIENGLATLLREIERACRFGFTESEYTRARADYLRQLESSYNERDKRRNNQYVSEYVNHFLDKEPIPGIEYEYTTINQIAPAIPVEAINELIQELVSKNNQVVALFGPEKESVKYPAKADILRLLKASKEEELTAYVDKVSDEPLIAQPPTGGTIISEKAGGIFGTTQLTLSNGVKVLIKKTDFKADEILMKGVSLGGNSLFPDNEIINIKSGQVASVGGLGNLSNVDLEKVLAGKKANVSAFIGTNTEGVSGSCSPTDFETLMQLTYLTFTAPRKDADAFASYKNRSKASLQNQELNPMVAFVDSIQSALYQGHPRAIRLKTEMIDKIDYDKILSMYNDRFKDASDFTFILIGNVEIDAVKPLIAQYLGALPAINRQESFKNTQLNVRKGTFRNEFVKEADTPKASVFTYYSGDCAYTPKNQLLLSFVDQVLDLVYTEKIREQEGGTYGVSVSGGLEKYPAEKFGLQIVFDTDPEKKDNLIKIVFAEIETLSKEGASEANLNKVKEFLLKKHKENLKENSYWLSNIDEYLYTGVDLDKDYESIVNSITAQDIQQFAAFLFSQNNQIEVTMISPNK
jgi:zinc protease